MFRAAHRSSSGALNCICSLWFIYTCGDRSLSRLSGKSFPTQPGQLMAFRHKFRSVAFRNKKIMCDCTLVLQISRYLTVNISWKKYTYCIITSSSVTNVKSHRHPFLTALISHLLMRSSQATIKWPDYSARNNYNPMNLMKSVQNTEHRKTIEIWNRRLNA